MASINQELEDAKATGAAMKALLTATLKSELLATVKNVYRVAVLELSRSLQFYGIAIRTVQTQSGFSSEDALINARHKVGLALLPVIIGLEQGQKNQGDINNAKSAIEAWIKELKGSTYRRR